VAIDRFLRERGLRPEEVKGYVYVVSTHSEAAEAVAKGDGDYTIVTRYAAERRGLRFIKLYEEDFDFVARREKAGEVSDLVKRIKLIPGYAAKPNMGQVITP